MNARNFLKADLEDVVHCHEGEGIVKNVSLFTDHDFSSKLRFINYTILPSGTSIGVHKHGKDEEVYVILEGQGLMEVDGEQREVRCGDVIVNKAFGEHGLVNNSEGELKIFVFEVGI
jgi:mannose-6-phosphate isomerase-like protein (cupin superfamily)